ncbi:tautomerase family protein [Leucobacter komagatae]|uniref:4-oxalocrotonate tautomerase-like domain-containing protein n=1 Tax=Leucobacter komagatae TaxID=55969 RepID=A0A0D0I0N7_9MICO|nr:tautomerase family protein [Leucobacter komagatae]KIP53351.1 hypothetical protein SD72_03730 [Leucobacter komagatae]
MVSVVATTDLPLERVDIPQFVDRLGEAARIGLGLPPGLRSVYLVPLTKEYTTAKDGFEATIVLYSAPGKTLEQKRAAIADLNSVVQSYDWGGDAKVVVIIKEHEPENVGVNGVLRWDTLNQPSE